MAEVTIMVLKVDLHCCKCYKKVKKVLRKFPEIRDQVYDEKQNTVTIKVVTCCPERMRQKIWCKGGKSIKSIEIKPPEKKKEEKPPEKKKDEEKAPEKKKDEKAPEKKKDEGKVPEKKKDEEKADKPIKVVIDLQPTPKPKPPEPAPCYPPWYGYPIPYGVCCRDCYEGRGVGPCQQLGYVCRYPCYCGCYGRPVFDSWGGCNRGYYWSRCEIYCEENPSACSVM